MIRVLTHIAIALFFIGYPPFQSIAKSEVVLVLKHLIHRVVSVQPSISSDAVFHCDEFMVWPPAPNPIVSPGWLAPDRSPTSGRIALAPSRSSKRRARNRGCIVGSLQ